MVRLSRMTPKRTPRTSERTARKALGKRQLEELIEEAIIDAYGESEQRVGFLTMLENSLAVPFTTDILGVPVRVERVGLNDAEEIVVVCRRERQRQLIPILDLPLPSPPPAGWEWIEAYRYWVRGGR
jgi:Calcium binding